MAQAQSRIRCEVDFEKSGRQASYLRAPLSRDTSGWARRDPHRRSQERQGTDGAVPRGVHGNDMRVRSPSRRLARTLDPKQIEGRVILMPAVNMPAVLANTRLSPADGRDINRCFPGDPRGTFSFMLAHWMDAVLLPHVDVSGGSAHRRTVPRCRALSTNMHYIDDPTIRAETMRVASAFVAPYNAVFWGVDEGATFTSSVERQKKISIGTEIGGWGRVNPEGVRIAERGIVNVMKACGVMEGEPDTSQRDGAKATRHMMVKDAANFLFARTTATYEPMHLAARP